MDDLKLSNLSENTDFIREICSKLGLSDEIASDTILYIRCFFEYKENQNPTFQIKTVSNIVHSYKNIITELNSTKLKSINKLF